MKETPTSAVNRDDESLGSPAIKLFKPVTPRKLGIKCPPSLRNRVQSTCLDDAAHLKTYMRLWVFIEVMLLFHDPFLIPRDAYVNYVYPQLAAFALAFLAPNGWTFAAAFLATVSAPRARIFGRSVRTTSRPYYRHQADGSPKYASFSPCRCTWASTSYRVLID